jgi:hypothetical protein
VVNSRPRRGVRPHPLQLWLRTTINGRDNCTLGRFCAGATLKAALAKVQVDVFFGHIGQTGIGVCRGDGAARQLIQVHLLERHETLQIGLLVW